MPRPASGGTCRETSAAELRSGVYTDFGSATTGSNGLRYRGDLVGDYRHAPRLPQVGGLAESPFDEGFGHRIHQTH
jgi:hypothetical protein